MVGYIQLGKFRLGDVDGRHFTVIHTTTGRFAAVSVL